MAIKWGPGFILVAILSMGMTIPRPSMDEALIKELLSLQTGWFSEIHVEYRSTIIMSGSIIRFG